MQLYAVGSCKCSVQDSTPLAHLNPRIDGTIGAASQWKHATKKLQAVQVMIPPLLDMFCIRVRGIDLCLKCFKTSQA